MAIKNPKCLVIDTSVMFAASTKALNLPSPSQACADFLIEILKLGHSVIMTDEILEEWDRYNLTTKSFDPKLAAWYPTMRRKGKIRRHFGNTQNEELRQIIFATIDPNAVEAVRKDMRLIEAAILADELVASRDEKMRGHFGRASLKVEALQVIVWVNPSTQEENCMIWLREGAPADKERMLGFQTE